MSSGSTNVDSTAVSEVEIIKKKSNKNVYHGEFCVSAVRPILFETITSDDIIFKEVHS